MMLFFMLACGFALDLTPGDLCDGLDREHKLSNGSTICGDAADLHDPQIRVPLYVWGPGVTPGADPTPIPATCVGQTARLVLGEPLTDACDLRDGTIRGDVVAGMLLADGTWDERVILPTEGL